MVVIFVLPPPFFFYPVTYSRLDSCAHSMCLSLLIAYQNTAVKVTN
jgi:hypothetical protein